MTNSNLALKVKKPDVVLEFVNNLDLAKKSDIIIFLNFTYFD